MNDSGSTNQIALREAINRELPRTHKGFRCQYEQDAVMRALDKAFASLAPEPEAPREPETEAEAHALYLSEPRPLHDELGEIERLRQQIDDMLSTTHQCVQCGAFRHDAPSARKPALEPGGTLVGWVDSSDGALISTPGREVCGSATPRSVADPPKTWVPLYAHLPETKAAK